MIDPVSRCGGASGRQSRRNQQHIKHIMSNSTKVIKLVDDYANLNAQLKVLGELVDAAKAKIIAMGDGSYNGTAHKVVVSTSIPVRFDSAAFKEAHPTLYESFKAQGNAVTSARIHGR
jgi:hypothetical protein